MTTADERRRNLIWGREALEEFSRDAGMEVAVQRDAIQLLESYPTLDFLRHFDAGDPDELRPFAGALARTLMLFERVQFDGNTSEQRRYELKVVLRHFNW